MPLPSLSLIPFKNVEFGETLLLSSLLAFLSAWECVAWGGIGAMSM